MDCGTCILRINEEVAGGGGGGVSGNAPKLDLMKGRLLDFFVKTSAFCPF